MKLEVLKFSASWCGPCRVLSNTIKDVEGITQIDIEKDQETAIKYGIRSVPTLVKIDENGNVAGRLVGVRAKNLVEEFLND